MEVVLQSTTACERLPISSLMKASSPDELQTPTEPPVLVYVTDGFIVDAAPSECIPALRATGNWLLRAR